MTPFTFASVLALALVPGGQALVRFRSVADTCGDKCRADFGWPGHPFPNDPWGLVMDPQLMSSVNSSVAAIPTNSALANGAVGGVGTSLSILPDAVFTAFTSLSTASSSMPVSTPAPLFLLNISSSSFSTTSMPSNTLFAFTPEPSSPPTSSTALSPRPPSSSPSLPSISSSRTSSTSSPLPESTVSTSAPATSNSGPGHSNPNSGGPVPGTTSGPTSQSDIQAYLNGHNTIRAQHGAAPLTYSQNLAAKAQQWANGCIFKHSGGTLGPFGENLAAGTGSAYGIPQAIKGWTDEASQYNAGNPTPSHFTQVVWKGTTQVGCALQDCDGIFPSSFGKAHFYVCEYFPQGNIIGQFGSNVQA